ncbi:MAG: DUF5666 domain-containing protein [bacterium]
MKNTNLILAVALTAVVAGGGGFWGGTKYSQNQRNDRFGQIGNRTGNTQNSNNVTRSVGGSAQPGIEMMRGGAVVGEVTAKDDKSMTVKLPDGSSKIVILSSTTTYRMASETTADELQVGKSVAIQGTHNADGSTTATSIELNPVMRGQTGNN